MCVCVCTRPTRAGGVRLVLIVSTVVVSVTQPAERNTAVILALKPVGRAGVLVWGEGGGGGD